MFIPHDWEKGECRGNMVRGAVLNTSFHKKSKGVSEKSKGVSEEKNRILGRLIGICSQNHYRPEEGHPESSLAWVVASPAVVVVSLA